MQALELEDEKCQIIIVALIGLLVLIRSFLFSRLTGLDYAMNYVVYSEHMHSGRTSDIHR